MWYTDMNAYTQETYECPGLSFAHKDQNRLYSIHCVYIRLALTVYMFPPTVDDCYQDLYDDYVMRTQGVSQEIRMEVVGQVVNATIITHQLLLRDGYI